MAHHKHNSNRPELTPGERIQAAGEAVQWIEAAEGEPSIGRFTMTAYTGGPMSVSAFMAPVVIDLAGLDYRGTKPILLQHEPRQIVGHGEATVTARTIKVAGTISGGGASAEEVRASGRNGFPWKASVGVSVQKVEFVERGTTAQANGLTVQGPANIVRGGTLQEVSFVPIAADARTSVHVAASNHKECTMHEDLKKFIEAAGFDPESLSDAQVKHFEAAFDASTPQDNASDVDAPRIDDGRTDYRRQIKAEAKRVADIGRICKSHPDIYAQALEKDWDAKDAELAVKDAELKAMREQRGTGPAVHVAGSAMPEGRILEAALCMAGGYKAVDTAFDAKTLEAAHPHRNMGLQELLIRAARGNGYDRPDVAVNSGNIRPILKAAFSTHSLSGILGNTANKFLMDAFSHVDSAWREVASTRPVSDFKTSTSYRLTGDLVFQKVGPGGELKHDSLSETSYTNKADTYGRMYAITRQDIINDDLGALTAVPARIGRGSALSLNQIFWTEFFADHATFFPTAGTLGNYLTTALGSAGLAAAEKLFLEQTDEDGNPMGIMPALVLVPPALSVTAQELYVSTNITSGATSKTPTANVFAGRYKPVVSPYVSNASYGNSSTHFYLLANPADASMIEVCFLNGQETPTVESADADFDVLGIQMRGYYDFGVNKQEYRAAVKSAGTG